jgi:hypothetical protein
MNMQRVAVAGAHLGQESKFARFRTSLAAAGTRYAKRSARVTLVGKYLTSYSTLAMRTLVGFLLLASTQLAAQTPNNSDKPMSLPRGAVQTEVPAWTPFPIQPELYW